MTVQEVCQKLFDSSSGILAVGITAEKKNMLSGDGAFLGENGAKRPWKELLLDAYRVWQNANRHRSLDKLSLNIENLSVGVYRKGPWVIVVGTVVGHDVRKSLNRLLAQSFTQLEQMKDRKVIPLFPNRRRPKPGKGKGADHKNLNPG